MSETSPRILKANTARDLPGRVAFNFEDLRDQAAQQLLQARAEATAILDQARKEAAQLKQTAIAEGQAQGKQEGLKTAQTQIQQQATQLVEQRFAEHLKTTLPALTQVAQQLAAERDGWLLRWEHMAVELGVAIAEKLLRTNLAIRPELAIPMITEALQLAAGQTQLRLRLHPGDLDRLGTHAADVVRSLTTCAQPELVADESITPGGCVIDTQHGEIDARLETMLERIASELLAQ